MKTGHRTVLSWCPYYLKHTWMFSDFFLWVGAPRFFLILSKKQLNAFPRGTSKQWPTWKGSIIGSIWKLRDEEFIESSTLDECFQKCGTLQMSFPAKNFKKSYFLRYSIYTVCGDVKLVICLINIYCDLAICLTMRWILHRIPHSPPQRCPRMLDTRKLKWREITKLPKVTQLVAVSART